MFAFRIARIAAAAAVVALAACAGQNSTPSVSGQFAAAQPLAATVKITASPAKLNFTTSPTIKLTISETNYKGTFKLAMNPTGIVKLSKSTVKGPKATIKVTALNAGKTTITVTDQNSVKKTIPVTVTQGVIIIQ